LRIRGTIAALLLLTAACEDADEGGAGGDASDVATGEDAGVDAEVDTGRPIPQDPVEFPPDGPGRYAAGVREFDWRDMERGNEIFGRNLASLVWYPAVEPQGGERRTHFIFLEGAAWDEPDPDRTGAPYPLVLFSHGNKGINFQSYTLTAHLATHGFIVAAPNHEGNLMFDSPNDEALAEVAMNRPIDMAFIRTKVAELNDAEDSPLRGMIDTTRVAIAGHSFGGFTTLLLAGAPVDVDAAVARCAEGIPGDVFCPSIVHWPRAKWCTGPSR
jgi:predicted dienelactone hydrolase